MGIVRNLFSRKGSKANEPAAVATMNGKPASSKLMMLMPDASGIATYRLHTFVSAGEAEEHLDSILRGDVQEGTIMFWGLTWSPSDSGNRHVEAEPVVLVRDPSRPGLVYTFSFVDLDSAYDFVRHEMKAGLDLMQTAIFWAVPAEATANHWGEITVTPGLPPTRESASNGGAPLAAPRPLVTPDRDEPNGITQLHIDEPPRSCPPEAADEPEAVSAPEATGEPPHKAIEDTTLSKVIDILRAKDPRTPSNAPQPIDEPGTPEGTANPTNETSPAGKGDAHVAQEAEHIDLSDVFVGRRDPKPGSTLRDFRWSSESRNANGVTGATESTIEAQADTVSGIVAAWSNIGAAIDRAIDAQVARNVSATIAWRRLTRGFASAANVRLLLIWGRLAQAFYAGAAIQSSRERALAKAWRNATRALFQAAESKSGRRAIRLAWANISWTLEEAVYAARLQQKKATARTSWSTATSAVGDAVIKQSAYDSGLRTAWQRLAAGSLDAAKAQESCRARTAFAWASIGIALNEYATTKLHHRGLVVSWTRLAIAIEAAAEAAAQREPALAEAWHNLTRALAAAVNARSLVTWRPITQALYAGATIQLARERALAAVWYNASRALHQAVESRSGRRAKRRAWANISWTLEEAVYAARLQQKKATARAWPNASSAIAVAARKKDSTDRVLRTVWTRLASGIQAAAAQNIRRNGLISARRSVSLEVLVTADRQADRRKRAAIQAWGNAMIALNEAGVAEAQVRIAEAGLNEKLMKRVISAIGKVRGRKTGSPASKSRKKTVKVAGSATGAAAAKDAGVRTAKRRAGPSTVTKATKTKTSKKAAKSRVKAKGSPKAVAEKRSATDEQATAIDTWRTRESGRFTEKKGPFESFDSPPGRF